jgi:ribosomal protein S28E/S33
MNTIDKSRIFTRFVAGPIAAAGITGIIRSTGATAADYTNTEPLPDHLGRG